MSSPRRIGGNEGEKPRTIDALSRAETVVSLGVVSVLLLVIGSSYPLAVAQQKTIGGDNSTTDKSSTDSGIDSQASDCAPTQSSTSSGTRPIETNSTTSTTGGTQVENESRTSEAKMHISEACIALRAGDTQSALMHLNLALNALTASEMQSNVTTTASTPRGNSITASEGDCDGITVGGTSAADDYDCTPDAE
jgi:hypothetical protein